MPIETGVLLTGAEPVKNGKHQVWQGTVRVSSNKTVKAFIKQCPPRELTIEVIATVIGRSLGLPLPFPLLVQVMPGRLRTAKLNRPETFFGSQSQREPDLTQFIQKASDETMVIRRLKSWPHAAFAGCFDEWIANEDRNLQNLLYDGSRNFTLIDHGLSFPIGMAPSAPTTKNFLLDVSINRPDISAKDKVTQKAVGFMRRCESMSLDELLTSVANTVRDEEYHTSKIREFLHNRLPQLGEIIANKLGDGRHDSLFGSASK